MCFDFGHHVLVLGKQVLQLLKVHEQVLGKDISKDQKITGGWYMKVTLEALKDDRHFDFF